MKLYLQFGHGMMEHCRHLIQSWNGGTVVLSPRDLEESRMQKFADRMRDFPDTSLLFDPQLYLPRSNHETLCAYSYWPSNYSTGVSWEVANLRTLLSEIFDLNARLGSDAIILPGLLASEVSDDWLDIQSAILNEAAMMGVQQELYPTIALSDAAILNTDQISKLLEAAESWDAPGYYLVCQHPRGEYLVNNPVWVSNILDIAAGIKLNGAKVILGYCSHQMLISACAKVDAICSGTFLNVRSFPPEKFSRAESDPKQRSTWFYCPQGLSEYKDSFLDIAHRIGVLDDLRPEEKFGGYANRLFSGPQPTTIGLKEPVAFRHYLNSLHVQALSAEKASFDETVNCYEETLNRAEDLLSSLHQSGIRGQQRDFRDIIDVQRAAIAALVATRGPILRRHWSAL